MAGDVLDGRIEAPISHAGGELETLLEDWERESQTKGYVRRCLTAVFSDLGFRQAEETIDRLENSPGSNFAPNRAFPTADGCDHGCLYGLEC